LLLARRGCSAASPIDKDSPERSAEQRFAGGGWSDAQQLIGFHFGLPSPELLERVRSWEAVILSSATTVDEALWLEAHGADAIIAQGLEAGGHRGHFLSGDLTMQMGTFVFVPQIAREVKVPVIAAGGIADSHGVAAAKALGRVSVGRSERNSRCYLCGQIYEQTGNQPRTDRQVENN